jgi:zinc/manganese transport system permease protein
LATRRILVVGIFHFLLRRNFFLVSFDRDRGYQQGLRVRWWDFSFYASFGLIVTIFVRMAGVLLVFSYLIVPAVCVINLVSGVRARLIVGWIIATIGGIGGLFWSFYGDLPSGAAIVYTFGGLLIAVSAISPLLHSKRA